MHEGVNDLALEIMPFAIAEKHSIDMDHNMSRKLLDGGILKTSAMISRSNIRRNLGELRKAVGAI